MDQGPWAMDHGHVLPETPCNSAQKAMAHGPYDFDFGTLERMPQECFHLICARMMVPTVTPQQLYFAQLMKVSNVISEALINESGHGEYDWAEFLLNVDTFQEFSEKLFNEYGYPSGSPI